MTEICWLRNIHTVILIFGEMFVGHFLFSQELLTSIHQLLVVDWLNSLDRISKVQLNLRRTFPKPQFEPDLDIIGL